MKLTRLVELTLYYKVRELFMTAKTGEVAKSADFHTYSVKYKNIDTNHDMVVYVNNSPVSSGFTIDYINGLIIFNSALAPTDVVKADYWYCPINIYDEGEDPRGNTFQYPAIAIFEDTGDTNPIELGSGLLERDMYWIFEVWSERGGERNDIVDTLVEFFQEAHIPIINYNLGFPTNEDGSKNVAYDPNNLHTFATCDSINYSKDGSLDIGDKPKYMSQIHVNLRVNP